RRDSPRPVLSLAQCDHHLLESLEVHLLPHPVVHDNRPVGAPRCWRSRQERCDSRVIRPPALPAVAFFAAFVLGFILGVFAHRGLTALGIRGRHLTPAALAVKESPSFAPVSSRTQTRYAALLLISTFHSRPCKLFLSPVQERAHDRCPLPRWKIRVERPGHSGAK